MDLEYLGRRLNAKSYEALEAFRLEVARITRESVGTGNLNSSRTQLIIGDAAVDTFTKRALDAAQFTYDLTENHGDHVTAALKFCMGRMADMIRQELESGFRSAGDPGILNRTRDRLAQKNEQLIDDYAHGMMGSTKMKKNGSINIIQNNSPGGVQQVGSNFSQSVFNQTHHSLVQEIDKALASPEFKALAAEDQLEVHDLADAVKFEAEKSQPDAGKLKRWGDKLVKTSADVGLKVLSSTIAALLLKIYTG
ncbi:hypothetical protein BjapCC829_23725 [Bradyrhizobium barranii]|uniref:Uncharacterized protein n=1 Tax=Bradyrhizobium barranii TaxID=2992140 RepID=A0ABY3QAZ6_9BRAD|nr:hypothetical protein [Bradyrhizobium japonicum]UFW82998.1 hypothetical protein BjapCC829_23725 [Bradyrhizobium japonicum]